MAASHSRTVDFTTLNTTNEPFSAALLHLRKLLRVRNRMCSPFLRLPTEIIVRIVPLVNKGCYHHWRSIFSTCHRIFEIMLGSTEVWWEVYFNDTASSLKAAYIALLRSGGNPRKLVAKLDPRNSSIHSDVVGFLTSCKDVQVFQGDRLHTLEFYGISLIFPHFSWLLQGSLPRLEHLKIKFYVHPVPPTSQKPVVVCLPTDISLRTLDLCNVVLSWSPAHLTGLRELHLRFEILWDDVPMPGDQLFRILDASPRLERLSLDRGQPAASSQTSRPPSEPRFPFTGE